MQSTVKHDDISVVGGWTRVAVVKTDKSDSTEIQTFDDPSEALRRNENLMKGISFIGLQQLKKTIRFTQMRFRCVKGETTAIDVITLEKALGYKVVEYFTSSSNDRPLACDSFTRGETDNSKLSGSCERWNDQKWGFGYPAGNQRLYGVVFYNSPRHFIMGGHASNNVTRFECDDGPSDNIKGLWAIFVR